MTKKVKWGVLGVASIAMRKVIPGMQKGAFSEIVAIASRDLTRAQAAARELSIPKAYGSYEDLLADREIEAVYNPLPNHLHVPWSIKAAEAGKHVLCEKPIGLNAAEAVELVRVRDRTNVKIGEAFMVKTHPQWLRVRELIRSGKIGQLKSIITVFSYFNRDPGNVRHKPRMGRWRATRHWQLSDYTFALAVRRGAQEGDWSTGTRSRLCHRSSGFRDHGVFLGSCGFFLWHANQLFSAHGNTRNHRPPCRRNSVQRAKRPPNPHYVADGMAIYGGKVELEEIPACDQYTIQGDAFSRAIRDNSEVPVPLEDALANMKVIDAIFRSAKSGRWEQP